MQVQPSSAGDASSHRVALLAVALLGAVISHLTFADFLLEDSYISLRYATHLAAGNGLVFQTGEAIFGTSSPLWAMLLSLPILLGVPPEIVLDMTFSGSMVFLAYAGGRLLQRLGAPRMGVPFALALFAGVGRLHAYWGMETPLFIGLVFGAWCSALDRKYIFAGIVLGLGCLARYEGYAFAVALALMLSVQKNWKAVRSGGLAIAAITSPWLVVAWRFYGSPIPGTAGAKAGHVSPLRYVERTYLDMPHDLFWAFDGLGYQHAIGLVIGVLAALLGIVGVARMAKARSAVAFALPLGALFVYAGLVAMSPGPAFAWHRAPVHFVGLLCAFAGAGPWLARLRIGPKSHALRLAATATVLAASVPTLLHGSANLRNTFQYAGRETAYIEVADFLVGSKLNECTVLTWEPGYLAYMSDARVIDLVGLVTPAPAFTRKAIASWDSDFPPEADLVLLRAPYRPAGFDLVFEGSMGSRLFARHAITKRYTESIAAYRASNSPKADAHILSTGPVPIEPSYRGAPLIVGEPGTWTSIDLDQEPLSLTAETTMLWLDTPELEVEFQTPTPGLVQLQLVVRGEVVLATGPTIDPTEKLVHWDVSPWIGRTGRVRVLAVTGSGAQGSFRNVKPGQ